MKDDTCSIIVDKFGYIAPQEFQDWNPAVQSDCSGLWAGYYYCIANYPNGNFPPPPTVSTLPSPVQTGITSQCVAWYEMTGLDTCDSIAEIFGTFSKADFMQWNPAVGTDCSGLM